MEEWNFPPSYSDDYFPDPNSRYWFRDRETMDPEKRDELIVARIREVMTYAYDHSPFYQGKWDEAGIKANDIRTLADFEQVPAVTKRNCVTPRPKNRHSGTIFAALKARSTISTAPLAQPAGLPLLVFPGVTGRPLPTTMPGSCGAWVCGREIQCLSPPF